MYVYIYIYMYGTVCIFKYIQIISKYISTNLSIYLSIYLSMRRRCSHDFFGKPFPTISFSRTRAKKKPKSTTNLSTTSSTTSIRLHSFISGFMSVVRHTTRPQTAQLS